MLSERLKLAMKEAGISQADLARACHVKPPSVHGWLSGKSKFLRGENLLAAAKVLKVSQLWLATGAGPMRPSAADTAALVELDVHPDILPVSTVKLKLQCGLSGFGVEVDEEPGNPIFFRAEWFAKRGYRPDRLYAIKAAGESMEPTIYAGDAVVINTADAEPRDGDVYAINNEGEPVIKRVIREDGKWWMESDNQDKRRYPRKGFGPDTFIVGRVVHRQSERV